MARVSDQQTQSWIVTANHLFEGDTVYLTANWDWTRRLDRALVAHAREEADLMLTIAEAQQSVVIGPYLAETTVDDAGSVRPAHYREAIRTTGPTIPVGEAAVRSAAQPSF